MGVKGFLTRFSGNAQGAIAIWAALGMTMILGTGAIAIDLGRMIALQTDLQYTADAAAAAAAQSLPDQLAASTKALTYAEKNMAHGDFGTVVANGDITTGNWDSTNRVFSLNGTPVNAIRVITRQAQSNGNAARTLLASALGIDTVDLSASAIAVKKPGGACLLALDPSADKALEVKSNAKITASDCNIVVNSSSSSGLYADSNALVAVAAGNICVVGGYASQSNSDIDPLPATSCEPYVDPMAGLAAPAVGGCNHNNHMVDGGAHTLNPGVYCGGLTIKNNSNVTLNPGTYIIKDAEFLVDSNSNLSGAGVFFYLADGAYLNFNSNTTVTLSAPATGIYAGILMFAEPGNNVIHVLDSNNVSSFDGLIYFPDDKFEANSNSLVVNGVSFTLLIAKTFLIDSNAHLQINPGASALPMPSGLMSGMVSLVN